MTKHFFMRLTYDLGARLCRIGDYLTLIPAAYAREPATFSSSTNTRKLFDVIDWFDIPGRYFDIDGSVIESGAAIKGSLQI